MTVTHQRAFSSAAASFAAALAALLLLLASPSVSMAGTAPDPTHFKAVEVGKHYCGDLNYCLAIAQDDSLWFWGYDYGTQKPAKNGIAKPFKVMNDVKAAYAGYEFAGIIKNDDSLWLVPGVDLIGGGEETFGRWRWGDATKVADNVSQVVINRGMLGGSTKGVPEVVILKTNGDVYGANCEWDDWQKPKFKKVITGVKKISTSNWGASVALRENGELWGFGANAHCYVSPIADDGSDYPGLDETEVVYQKPVLVAEGVADVNIEGTIGIIVRTDKSLWIYGKYLLDCGASTSEPVKVDDGVSKAFSDQYWGVYALDAAGNLSSMSAYGLYRGYPLEHVMSGVKEASGGDETIAVIKDDDTLWTWGENSFGQLGDGQSTYRFVDDAFMVTLSKLALATKQVKVKSISDSAKGLVCSIAAATNTIPLIEGRDYTLKTAGSVQKGTATVTIEGMGWYSGSKTVRCQKALKPVKIKSFRSADYGASVEVTFSSAGAGVRYQVQIAPSKSFKRTVSDFTTSKTTASDFIGVSSKQYVRVRAYCKVGSTYCYTAWSPVKSIRL